MLILDIDFERMLVFLVENRKLGFGLNLMLRVFNLKNYRDLCLCFG